MISNLAIDQQYREWLATLKHKVRYAQIKAAVRVNTELLTLVQQAVIAQQVVAQLLPSVEPQVIASQ